MRGRTTSPRHATTPTLRGSDQFAVLRLSLERVDGVPHFALDCGRTLHDRLGKTHRDGDLGKKDFGNRVVRWAEVAPALDPELEAERDETADEENSRSMDELDERLDD